MHVPVLFDEVMQALQPRPGGRYLDCTVGNGGHTEGLLNRCAPDGIVLGLDADPSAIARVRARLPDERLLLHPCWLDEAPALVHRLGFVPLDGILIDLGLSSNQLEESERGFSFMREGPLDMRFDPTRGMSAAEWLDATDLATLTRVLREYGEVPNASRVARALWQARPLRTTSQLRDVVAGVIKPRSRRIHPATQVFQALRIAVNDELERLRVSLPNLIELLTNAGRIAVIAFHSLEDRIVKEVFKRESIPRIVQPGFGEATSTPPRLRVLTRRPITPSAAEVAANPRARSARLRVAERIGG